MKIHKSNKETIEAWVEATGQEGANSNRSLSYCGNELYSYKTIIAKKIKNDVCLINLQKYSSTTTAHQNLILKTFKGLFIVGAWELNSQPRYGSDIFNQANIELNYSIRYSELTEKILSAFHIKSAKIRYEANLAAFQVELDKLVEHQVLTNLNSLNINSK